MLCFLNVPSFFRVAAYRDDRPYCICTKPCDRPYDRRKESGPGLAKEETRRKERGKRDYGWVGRSGLVEIIEYIYIYVHSLFNQKFLNKKEGPGFFRSSSLFLVLS